MERLLSVLTEEAKKLVDSIGKSGIFYTATLKGLKEILDMYSQLLV